MLGSAWECDVSPKKVGLHPGKMRISMDLYGFIADYIIRIYMDL